MKYELAEDGAKLCRCPVCGWSGTLHETEAFDKLNENFEIVETVQICPKCIDETEVIAII